MGKDASTGVVNPPPVIRGLDSQTDFSGVGIHWFRGSFPESKWKEVLKYMTGLFGEPEYADWSLWHYDGVMQWPNGMRVHFHTREDRYHLTQGRFSLECPGESLAAMDANDLLFFLEHWAEQFEISVTRIDERWLDFEWIITPYDLANLVVEFDPATKRQTRRDYSGFKCCKPVFEVDGERLREASVNFGKRGSDGGGSYLRGYDKSLESKGKIDAMCWELESSGDKARARFAEILGAIYTCRCHDRVREAAKVIGQHIGGCIDFIRRDAGDKNLSRCPRYEFWEKILERLGGRLRWFGEKVVKTVEKAKGYIERQVVPSLQMLKLAFGEQHFFDWFLNEVLDGEDRLRAAHHKAIAAYQATVSTVAADVKAGFQAFQDRESPPPLSDAERAALGLI